MESNSKKSASNLIKRALCYALTTVMVISGFNMVPMTRITAEAAGNTWSFVDLEEGRYKITPATNPNVLLGVSDQNVLLTSGANQRWILEKNNEGDNAFRYLGTTNKYIDISGNSSELANERNAQLFEASGEKTLHNTLAFKVGNNSITSDSGYLIYCGNNSGTDYVLDVYGNNITSGTNVYAYSITGESNQRWTFTPINYTVSFNANGGTGTMNSQTVHFDKATNLSKNAFTRDGYAFAGWTTTENGTGNLYSDEASVTNLVNEENGSVTLFAQWTKGDSRITFNKNAEDAQAGTTSIEAVNGESVADIIVPTREGYAFGGYYVNDKKLFDAKGSLVKGVEGYTDADGKWNTTNDVIVSAKWVQANSTIKFYDSNDVAATLLNTINIKTGNNVAPVKVPTKVGAEFLGYFTKETTPVQLFDKTGYPVTADGYIVNGKWAYGNDVDLVAHWTSITNKFVFSDKIEKDFLKMRMQLIQIFQIVIEQLIFLQTFQSIEHLKMMFQPELVIHLMDLQMN